MSAIVVFPNTLATFIAFCRTPMLCRMACVLAEDSCAAHYLIETSGLCEIGSITGADIVRQADANGIRVSVENKPDLLPTMSL